MTKLNGITASDLMALDLPEARWAAEGIVPEGVSLLVSRPKLGKSYMALDLALAVATGGKALGCIPVEGGEALGLFLEDNRRRLKKRLKGLLEGAPAPKALHLFTEWRRADKGGLEELDAWLAAHAQTRIVIIDTLARFRPTNPKNSSQYAQDYDALAGLQTLAGRHQVAVLILHHDRKLGADDWIDQISGTLGLSGAADGLLGLFRPRGSQDGTLKVTGRDVEEAEFAVHFDAGKWTLMGRADEVNVSPERRLIIDLLAVNPPMMPAVIASTLGKNASTVRTLLQKLVDSGQVVRIGAFYTLPSRAIDSVDSVDNTDTVSTASTVSIGHTATSVGTTGTVDKPDESDQAARQPTAILVSPIAKSRKRRRSSVPPVTVSPEAPQAVAAERSAGNGAVPEIVSEVDEKIVELTFEPGARANTWRGSGTVIAIDPTRSWWRIVRLDHVGSEVPFPVAQLEELIEASA